MTKNINDLEQILLSEVKDISGLQDISMFPLAVGWWIIITIILLVGLSFLATFLKKQYYKKSWKFKVINRLDEISNNLAEDNIKNSLQELSEILKRIAIQTYGRKEVAGLTGTKWLKWLEIRDPGSFKWEKNGDLIVNYPFMPEYKILAKEKDVKDLAKAIKNWL